MVLYVDKGFATGSIITYLTEQNQFVLIVCPIRGRTDSTCALCQGGKVEGVCPKN
jgi:hypothetical protein